MMIMITSYGSLYGMTLAPLTCQRWGLPPA